MTAGEPEGSVDMTTTVACACGARPGDGEHAVAVDPEIKRSVLTRLRRIEGQVRGVQNMIGDERDCREIVQQLAAIRSAVSQTALEVIRTYATQCLHNPEAGYSEDDILDYVLTALAKWS